MTQSQIDGQALGPYRVLDLTEGGFNWCGKVLADLGADVVKIEPPGGSPYAGHRAVRGRSRQGMDRSLVWAAYCANKRGVTIDLDSRDGCEQLVRLASGADILIESFRPGLLEGLGLGYSDLAVVNPGLVYTSITPYGQTGPYAQHEAPDLVAWSMGGMQYICGDADRPPVPRQCPASRAPRRRPRGCWDFGCLLAQAEEW